MAAANDRRRFGGNDAVGPRHASKQPAIEVWAGKQPLAGNLRAGDLPFGNQFVELALPDAEIFSGLRSRQQPRACALLHMPARILLFDFSEQSTPNAPKSRFAAPKCNLLLPSTSSCTRTRISSRSCGCRLPLPCRPPSSLGSLVCRSVPSAPWSGFRGERR